MPGTILNKYGQPNIALNIAITGLPNLNSAQSVSVDNTTTLFIDSLVQTLIKTSGAGTFNTSYVDVYAYGTSNSGLNFSGTASGVNSLYTGSLLSLFKLGRIPATANSTVFIGGPWSVASAFGASLPDHWGIVVDNESSGTLDLTVGSAWYQGVYGSYT